MSRYFFDVVSRSRSVYDTHGTWLSDIDEARAWAQLLTVVVRVENEKQELVDGQLHVRGPGGVELFSIPIGPLDADVDQTPAGCIGLNQDDKKLFNAKSSPTISGRWSSVRLEEAFWKGLKRIAAERRLTLSVLVETINSVRHQSNMLSAIRLFVLDYYRMKIGGIAGAQSSALEPRRHIYGPEPRHSPLMSIRRTADS